MKNLPFLRLLVFAAFSAFISSANAGRININLAQFHDTDTGFDGEGPLGGGLWNRINFADAAKLNPLAKSHGTSSRVTATETGTGNPAGATQDGNDLQDESWGNHLQEDPADREIPVELTIAGLLPGQVYKVVVYSDRVGSELPTPDTYTVNGIAKTLPNPGAGEDIPLPGVEGVDFAVFIVDATAEGKVVVSAPFIAAIQIEGVLDKGERGPQMDCRIARSGSGSKDKGNDVYGFRIMRKQSLVQRTTGRRAKCFYVKIQNDGEEIDRCYATGNWAPRAAAVRVIDRHTGENVTAAFRARNYRYNLCKDESRRFKVIVRPVSPRPTTIKIPICASPSTIYGPKLDCVTCVLKVK